MNKVFLCGHLTRDVELRHGQSTDVARVGIAVNRRKEGVDFFNLVAFGKGSRVLIDGRLQTSTYEKDGIKHTAFDVIVDNVEFADSKRDARQPDNDDGGEPTDDTPF